MRKIIVIGGGAAGMMAAIAAAESGASVTLLEKNEKLGKKIYITGKGRCNVTNACDKDDFFANVVTNPRFMYSSYGQWNNWDMYDYLERQGLSLKIERGNRVFPESDKSSDVIRTLQKSMESAGVEYHLHAAVRELWIEEPAAGEMASDEQADKPAEVAYGRESESRPKGKNKGKKASGKEKIVQTGSIRGVILSDGRKLAADAVIAATGGISYSSTGSTGDGYEWAKKAGHTLIPAYPALVPFNACIGKNIPCQNLQGLSLKNVAVEILSQGKKVFGGFGEMLFTHFGVSGPLLISASSLLTGKKDFPMEMTIDLKPALTMEQLDNRFVRELTAGSNKQLKNILGSIYPSKMIPVILKLASISGDRCGREISKEERAELVKITKAFPLILRSTRGFNEAIITQGGISVKEIDPRTMESKRVKGLYFAGEILDVDAYTGGYNLQIAWSSGYAAGKAAASEG